MKKLLTFVCALCFALCLGCDPRHGTTLGELLDGRHVIEAIDSNGRAFLVWKRGKLAVERGDKILIFNDDFTQARKVYQFAAAGNEYVILQCAQNSGLTHLLVVLSPGNMTGYNLYDPSTMPFAAVLAQGSQYFYQQDQASMQYRVWKVEGSDLYGPDFRSSPPGSSVKARKSAKRKKSGVSSSSEAPLKKSASKKQEELPLADLPDL